MNIFGWRLTNKPPEIESEQLKEVHKLLKEQKSDSVKALKDEKKKASILKKELAAAEKQEKKRNEIATQKNKQAAWLHVRRIERYADMMDRAVGARKSELKAIIDTRLEAIENLGININGGVEGIVKRLERGN